MLKLTEESLVQQNVSQMTPSRNTPRAAVVTPCYCSESWSASLACSPAIWLPVDWTLGRHENCQVFALQENARLLYEDTQDCLAEDLGREELATAPFCFMKLGRLW